MINIVFEIFIILFLCLVSINILYSYLFLFALLLPVKKKSIRKSGINRFAIVIPAHDEREVIGHLLESLSQQDYPKHAYGIFVIADNCADDTADIAIMKGAKVLRRIDTENQGKSYAIGWALKELDFIHNSYDALVIFDADNLVTPTFLSIANQAVNEGAAAFQGVVESKNPDDSWISIGNYITYSTLNRIHQEGRSILGLGALLCGTGMGFTKKVLREIGWSQTSLTEDREFTYKLLLHGIRVKWLDDAIIYDEKPISAKQSINQQSRWISGWTMDFKKYFRKLWQTWRISRDPALLEAMFNLVRPLLFNKGFTTLLLLLLLILFGNFSLWLWFCSLLILNATYYGVGLKFNHSKPVYYAYILIWPFSSLISIMAAVKSLFNKSSASWNHTKHTKAVTLDDINRK